ncbi:MAG: acyl carrier protein [Pseudomonadales bacterium]|nr:acyl carrier protein [Pseudomonadales bacterium]
MTNTNNEILQQLCRHLEQQGGGKAIDPDRTLLEQLALDSVKVLTLIMEIEDEFDVTIPINALADIQSVRDFSILIGKIKSQQ